jgi:23S rRNA maturation-related 3'-5' exoribonuclease YhaM
MIDLMNGLNGSNEKDEGNYVPCPACSELEEIKKMLSEYQTFSSENPIISIDLLLSEVKMWRSKDSYERKLKSSMIANMVKNLEANGFEVDGIN